VFGGKPAGKNVGGRRKGRLAGIGVGKGGIHRSSKNLKDGDRPGYAREKKNANGANRRGINAIPVNKGGWGGVALAERRGEIREVVRKLPSQKEGKEFSGEGPHIGERGEIRA